MVVWLVRFPGFLPMRYTNFDLTIHRRNVDGCYSLRSAAEFCGEVPDDWMELDQKSAEFTRLLNRINEADADDGDLVVFGKLLYAALFQSGNRGVERQLAQCQGRIHGKNAAVRIRLRIDDPRIAALPWELLYTPEKDRFLATSTETVLVRYLEMPTQVRTLDCGFPLKMLVVIPGGSGLDSAKEKTLLLRALKNLGNRVELVFLEGCVSVGDLDDALCRKKYHLVHFIGHGEFAESGASVFLNEPGDPEKQVAIDEVRFAQIFGNHQSIKLVVLNACEGATVSQVKPLAGVAPQLMRQGVPAVVAMQYSIFDDVAVEFSRSFYSVLLNGYSAGRIDVAMAQARNRLAITFPADRDIGAPVLFMRAPEGVLFSVPSTTILDRILERLWVPESRRRHEEATVLSLSSNVSQYRLQGEAKKADEEIEQLEVYKRKLKQRRLAMISTVAAGLIVFLMGWVGMFDNLFGLQSKMEMWAISVGNRLHPASFKADQIAIVAIGPDTESATNQGPWGGSWRDLHGDVLNKLAEGGARVAVFDISFHPNSEVADETTKFRDAIKNSITKGTSVIVGARLLDEQDDLKIEESLRDEVTGIGTICLDLSQGLFRRIPAIILRDGSVASQALCISAVAAMEKAPKDSITIPVPDSDAVQSGAVNWMKVGKHRLWFSNTNKVTDIDSDSSCQVCHLGDWELKITVTLSPLTTLRSQTLRTFYETVLGMSPDDLKRQFGGKIVIIGDQSGRDPKHVRTATGTETRHGVEIHADAINTILSNTAYHRVGPLGTALLMVGLAGIGAWSGWRYASKSARFRRAVKWILVLIYLFMVLALICGVRVILDPVVGSVSLWISFWLGQHLKNTQNHEQIISTSPNRT